MKDDKQLSKGTKGQIRKSHKLRSSFTTKILNNIIKKIKIGAAIFTLHELEN